MAVQADALTTRDNIKTSLGISASDTSKDAFLDSLIDRATAWIESRTERKLKARRYNNGGSTHGTTTVGDEDYIYFSGHTRDRGGDTDIDPQGYSIFYLPAWPVRPNDESNSVQFQLATLSERGSSISGGNSWDTSDLVEWDDYIVDRENGILRLLNGRFACGYRNYRIAMAAGYLQSAAPYIPADLEELCIAVAKKLFREDSALQSEKIGTWSRSYDTQKANAFIESSLSKYRRISL